MQCINLRLRSKLQPSLENSLVLLLISKYLRILEDQCYQSSPLPTRCPLQGDASLRTRRRLHQRKAFNCILEALISTICFTEDAESDWP